MRRRLFIIGSCALALAGCAEPVTHATPSGRPEVTISGRSSAWAKDRLTNEMLNRGYTVTMDSGSTVAFDRASNNALANAFFGSGYDGVPNARITYSIVQIGGDTRIVADMAVITNPGSAFERRTPMNNNQDSTEIQELLNRIKASA